MTAPLAFNTLLQASTSAVSGVRLAKQATARVQLAASVGVEHDLSNRGSTYSASGVSGLSAVTFNDNIRKTRSSSSVGALLQLGKGQYINAQVVYREEAFSRVSTTGAQMMYQASF